MPVETIEAPAAAPVETRADRPMVCVRAAIAPGSINAEGRTIEVVWSTGARVRRFDWDSGRYYDEELSLDASAVRMARLQNGAPVLNAHARYQLESMLGVVESATLTPGVEGRAVLRFSDRESVAPIWNDIRAGIVRHVSVGYFVHRYEIVRSVAGDGVDLWRAVDWEPFEISMVPVPFDAGAGVRSPAAGETRVPCVIINRAGPAHYTEEQNMPRNETTAAGDGGGETTRAPVTAAPAAPAVTAAPAAPIDAGAIARQATEAERSRCIDIRARCRSVGLGEAEADALIAEGVAGANIADRIVDMLAARGAAAPAARPRVAVGRSGDDPAEIRGAVVSAIAARATRHMPAAVRIEPAERARDYMGLSMLDTLAEYARAIGENVPRNLRGAVLYDHLVSMRALSTSDFPIILADSQNKVLIQAYTLAAPTYRYVAARKSFVDFKPHKFIRGGDFPLPLEVGEKGEFTFGAMGEAKNEAALITYGRIFPLSRRMIVNDDLAAFADIPAKAGRRFADFENATVWALLALNSGAGPTIYEKNMPTGRPLFHTDHGNLAGSATTIDITNVAIGRAAMMKQTSLDGLKINVAPRYLVTSPDKYTLAQQFCSVAIAPATDATANPFKGELIPVGDANLTGNAWYLFADPAALEVLIYGYLDGAEGPRLAVQEGFKTDGMDVRVSLDFACGAVDFRGAFKNAGA